MEEPKQSPLLEKMIAEKGVVVGGDATVNIYESSAAPRTPSTASLTFSALHQLPAPPDDFVGRKGEIDELLGEIDKGGVHISGAFGMGGVGKTALALVIADRLKVRYPDAQFHLDLRGVSDNPATPEEALAHVIRGFHPEAKLPESVAELQGIYLSLLDGKRAILLMDNARDAAQVEPLIPPKSCVLLVTSRNHFHLPGLYPKDLDKLPPKDAKDLLLTICKRIGGSAERIAELCGRLPMALRVAASTLNEYAILTPEDLAGRLSDETKKGKTLAKVYEAAFRTSDRLLNDDLRKKWYELSVFPADFDADAAAAVWQVTHRDVARDALGELVRLSLLEFIPATLRFRLHDLVRSYTAERMALPEQYAAQLRHAGHFRSLLAFANGLYMRGGASVSSALSLFDREWANIRAAFAWASGNAERDPNAATLCNKYPDAGAYCLDLRLHARERIVWLENALRAARTLKDRAAEGAHLGNLGTAHAALGYTRQGIESYEQSLLIMREIGDRRAEGINLGNIGSAYFAIGDARKAFENYEQALKVSREIGDRREEGNALGNIANAYNKLGDARRAIEYHEQALKVSREIGDRRAEGQELGNLGIAYATLGDARKAIEFFEQRLVIAREIGDRRGEGYALGNVGNTYNKLGDARRAIEYFDQVLVIMREIGDRLGEGNTLVNLGNAYSALGDACKAMEYYERQLVIAREIGDRQGESQGSWNLGLRYHDQGDLNRAVDLLQVRVDYYREIAHADAEKYAAAVEALRAEMKNK